MLCRVTHPHAAGVPIRRPPNATRHSSSMRQRAETLPFQAAWSAYGQCICLTELFVYNLYSMSLWFSTFCAVGFEGRNWYRLCSVLGHWSPGALHLSCTKVDLRLYAQ
jgi:hypothetical protein